jgi:hypothetical protein
MIPADERDASLRENGSGRAFDTGNTPRMLADEASGDRRARPRGSAKASRGKNGASKGRAQGIRPSAVLHAAGYITGYLALVLLVLYVVAFVVYLIAL